MLRIDNYIWLIRAEMRRQLRPEIDLAGSRFAWLNWCSVFVNFYVCVSLKGQLDMVGLILIFVID